MKSERYIYISMIVLLLLVCFYCLVKKNKVYVMFDGDKQYTYRYFDLNGKCSDSIKAKTVNKIIINGGDLLSYSWFEIQLDQTKRSKIKPTDFRKIIVNSPSFITNNYLDVNVKDMSKYRLYLVISEDRNYYIIPFKDISYSVN